MPPAAAADTRPLSETERKAMNDLLARDGAAQGPAVRAGDPYLALVNLNVPRRGTDPNRGSDLVYAGEVVHLTPEEAASFNRHGPKDGRQVEVLRKLSGPDGSREAPARIPPRAVSGPVNAPPVPAPGTSGPRPDPPGSSQILTYAQVPEAREPAPGDEQREAAADITDAIDLPPQRAAAAPRRR